ncbi:MAG: CBS domain-containing protein [Saprospiraceae bacterium]|nr:CBS domain-containing protein [Saprospiraceae bacterium]
MPKNFKQREGAIIDRKRAHKEQKKEVKDFMTKKRDLVTFKKDTPIVEVVSNLLKNRITGGPVLDEKGAVVGLIDDKDCLKTVVDSIYHNHPVSQNTAEQYMTNVMRSVKPEMSIVDAANIFLSTPFKRLLVVDNSGGLVGQISRRDVLRAIQD